MKKMAVLTFLSQENLNTWEACKVYFTINSTMVFIDKYRTTLLEHIPKYDLRDSLIAYKLFCKPRWIYNLKI
jgi:hypothetical protein